MATNTGKGSRKGAVKQQPQLLNAATGEYVILDPVTRQLVVVNKEGTPFKAASDEQPPVFMHPKATLADLRKAAKAVMSVMARKRAA